MVGLLGLGGGGGGGWWLLWWWWRRGERGRLELEIEICVMGESGAKSCSGEEEEQVEDGEEE